MTQSWAITVDGSEYNVEAEADTPLLYVLADQLGSRGPRFGCGLAQCGACSVLLDGREIRSCVYPVSAAANAEIVTAQGISDWYSGGERLHPLQEELIAAQAPQCGFCYGGMMVKAAELLNRDPNASREEIIAHMDGHICRCGTYPRLLAAIERAAQRMQDDA